MHGVIADSLPLYALGLLDGAEAGLVEAHLPTCAACRRELAALTAMIGLLAFAAPPARPDPAVKRALLARLRDADMGNGRPTRERSPR
jgi:anti-sigma factor RsiW